MSDVTYHLSLVSSSNLLYFYLMTLPKFNLKKINKILSPCSLLPTPYSQRGTSLIEALLGLAILLILFHSLASLMITAYDLLGNTRTRTTARYLANERIEEIRNLPYDNIGVLGGIPPGDLPQLQTYDRNGLTYTVRTAVVFIDDAFDNFAPADPYPTDYKRARVDVSWTGRFVAGESITMITDVASDEITSGGTLSILVFDANALPVPQASVNIINNDAVPAINLNLLTNDEGRIVLPGAPPCDNNCYEITVTKAGYNSDRTYGADEVANPDKEHRNIADGALTEISFSIDLLATIHFSSYKDRTFNYISHGYKTFDLKSGKIGTDTLGDPVYSHDQWHQTDASGNLTLPNMPYGNYYLALPGGDTWDLAGTVPLRPIYIVPGLTNDVKFTVTPNQAFTLLLTVTNASDSAIASASANLTGPGGYNQTRYTGEQDAPDFGQIIFSPLPISGSYDLMVAKAGFQTATETVSVSADEQLTVALNDL